MLLQSDALHHCIEQRASGVHLLIPFDSAAHIGQAPGEEYEMTTFYVYITCSLHIDHGSEVFIPVLVLEYRSLPQALFVKYLKLWEGSLVLKDCAVCSFSSLSISIL